MQITIKKLDEQTIHYAMERAQHEGWNPGLNDGKAFLSADPEGFFGVFDGDKPVGTISAVAYDEHYGFIGLYIVDEEYRKTNAGLILAQAALGHLGRRNVGLDGVLERVENYARLGYKFAYRNKRYRGKGGGMRPSGLVEAKMVPFDMLAEFDAGHFPAPREAFLREWINMPESKTYVKFKDGEIRAYGTVRRCHSGFKIGPLFALSPSAAEKVFQGLVSNIPGSEYYFDCPETNMNAMEMAKEYKMELVFETARMYSHGEPRLPMGNIYGITSFELG